MTTIACNREGMAADSFVSDGNRVCKIFRLPGPALLGVSGFLFHGSAIVKWIVNGERGPCPEPTTDEMDAGTDLMLLNRHGIFLIGGRGHKVEVTDEYAAIGSGSDIALGAMFHGIGPEEAVLAAEYHDSGTKGPVRYEPLRKQPTTKGK